MILETMTPLDFMEFRLVNLNFQYSLVLSLSYCRKDVMNDAIETALEK